MKIVCDSCATKYSISDDKVQGKVFKIRCKKCSHIIVVRGTTDAAPAPARAAAAPDGVWHLVVDGEQVGPLPDSDIRSRLRKGEITRDTYIWKEGFADWLKVSAVPEFADVASAGAPAAAGGEDPFPANERTIAHVPDQPLLHAATAPRAGGGANGGLFGTGNGASDDPFAAKPGAGSPGGAAQGAFAAAGKDDDVFGSAPARGGGGGGGGGGDLFASPAMAPAPFAVPDFGNDGGMQAAPADGGRVSNLTAQRSENSVLFSLSNLQSLAMPAPPSGGGGGAKPGFATSGGEGSGLIDIRSMAATTLGSGGGFGGSAKKQVDDLPTFGAAFQSVAPMLLPSSGSGGMPKWMYGVIALCVLLVAGIIVMVVSLVNKKEPPPVIVQAAPPPVAAAPVAAAPAAAAPVAAVPAPGKAGAEDPPREGAPDKGGGDRGGGGKHRKAGKGGDKGGKEAALAPAAKGGPKEAGPVPKEEPAPPPKKKGGSSLDELLGDAMGGNKKGPRNEPEDPSERKRPVEKVAAAALEKGEIVAAMRGVTPKISACYQQFKVPGMISVDVSVSPGGKVTSAKSTSKYAGTPTGNCVESAVKTASFRASADGLKTTYPFMLK